MHIIKTFLLVSLLGTNAAAPLWAQNTPQTDVAQMQRSAHDYLNRGDYPNAVMMFTQAIRLAPSDVSLRRDLAYTYYLSGDTKKAKEVIDPVLNSDAADEQTYQLSSAVENSLGNSGKAKRILNDGIGKYPNSGLLYNSKGNLFLGDKKENDALEVYKNGIHADPSYPLNYFNAAKIFLQNDNAAWALIYAEIYLNLDPFSQRTIEAKKLMIEGYRKILSPGEGEVLPDFKSDKTRKENQQQARNFTQTFKALLDRAAPAISDGLNTENLIMLRTRFMLAYTKDYAAQYPFTLLAYQNNMLHDGVYDAYNQWLFGAADNSQAFTLWVKNNNKEYTAFENWRKIHPLQPAAYDPQPPK
ncbi:MAG: tetratricopeptide repeat protein [Edaphocola sp.]